MLLADRGALVEVVRMNDLMKLALLLIVAPTCWHDIKMMEDVR